MKRMNEAVVVKPNVILLPGLQQMAEDAKKRRTPWWVRVLVWLGVLMVTKTELPRGFGLNPATVTLTITILCLIAAGAYYKGSEDAERRVLLERLAIAEKKAEQADTKATYAVSGKDKEDGHGPNASTKSK